MTRSSPRSRRAHAAVAAAVALPLALAACGGSSKPAASRRRKLQRHRQRLHHAARARLLQQRPRQDGLAERRWTPAPRRPASRSQREAVPGASLIPKVLQQASSRTLPDVLMLDNPDLQQIAATGALTPLYDFGINADGFPKGVVDASTYKGKLYGLQPHHQHDRAVLQQGHARQGRASRRPRRGTSSRPTPRSSPPAGSTASRSPHRRTTRAPGSSCRSCGPTAATRRTSTPRRPRRRCSSWVDLVKDGSAVEVRSSTGPRPTSTTSSRPARPR